MKKTITILFLLFINQIFSQTENKYSKEEIYSEIYGKCFKNLPPIKEIENMPTLQKMPFCSLVECLVLTEYVRNEKDIQEAILKRTVEITALLYNEGTPVYLTNGMDSSYKADEDNQDVTDDNNLIYISIAECTSSESLQKFKKTVNQETSRLISNKQKQK
ncbi:hypothetical protein [Flavobacterium sp. PL02]|uniref:hypothetical protein n=1 Tax=Flavobacterium sp. PL02 TaxID=3088354 RepID=UPI00057D227A|nr:hypothetical protein [Flavobacterium sp. PL02]KIC02889.1 hypothetical protein OA88_06240 [Flavobacterium sp. JRM]MEA9411733.1 hypothetical protein [Flavobacterium sp. PL02]